MTKHGGVYREMFTFHRKLLQKGGEILQRPAEKVVPLPTEKGALDTNALLSFSFAKNIA